MTKTVKFEHIDLFMGEVWEVPVCGGGGEGGEGSQSANLWVEEARRVVVAGAAPSGGAVVEGVAKAEATVEPQ